MLMRPTKAPRVRASVSGAFIAIGSRRLCYAQRQRSAVSLLALSRPTLWMDSLDADRGRHLYDGITSRAEADRARIAAMRAMERACDSDGDGGRLFPPNVPAAEALLGSSEFALFKVLHERICAKVCEECDPSAKSVGSLVSWISGEGSSCDSTDDLRSFNWMTDPIAGTYAPHIDKANRPEYDISALLYLSTHGEDFGGGCFAFNDPDADRLVAPVAGRLLIFGSGFENLHQVRRVTSGERLVLSVWFAVENDV